MVHNQARSNRKPSGGRYKRLRVRRQHQSGGRPAHTKVGSSRTRQVRTIGGNHKHKALSADAVSATTKDGKHINAKILSVKENAANRHFVRRNIITKGTLLETDKGLVRVTNRPGQDGVVHGVME